MRLRVILLNLSLIAFFSVVAGGYFYYTSLRQAFFDAVEQDAISHVNTTADLLAEYIGNHRRMVKVLSGLGEIKNAMELSGEEALGRANTILDRFQQAADVEACYLMDQQGRTIASSNRFEADSFVGKDYAFRPYFQEAMDGRSSVYLAFGVTTGKPGVFFSHPVLDHDSGPPIGVSIVKGSAENLVRRLLNKKTRSHSLQKARLFIIDPFGVIFLSDSEEFKLRTLWESSEQDQERIAATRQFGKGPWPWSGFRKVGKPHEVADASGVRYRMYEKPIEGLPGWKIVHLSNLDAMSSYIENPLLKTMGYLIVGLCILIGAAIFFLNHLARAEIERRKRAETSLKESEARLRTIIEHSNEFFYIHDAQHRLTYASPGSSEVLGYSPEETAGKWTGLTTDHPMNLKGIEITERAIRTGERQEPYLLELRRKDGRPVLVEIDESPIKDEEGRVLGIAGAARDVTQKIQAEKALRESEERYRVLVEDSFDGIFIQKGLKIVFANGRLHQMLGYEPGELLGMDHWLIYYQEYQELTRMRAQARMRDESVTSQYEVKLAHKDGSWFYGEISARVIRFDDEAGVQVWIKDIHQRKLAEQALRDSEMKYRTILESIEDGYYETDLEGVFTFFNDSLCRILGYPRSRLTGMPYQQVTVQDDWEKVYHIFNTVLVSGRPDRGFEWVSIRQDGVTRYVEASVSVRVDDEGKPVGFRGIVRDTTEKRRLEAQLQQAQKMEAIGTLAGGVAHDLNNILSGLVSYPELLLMRIPQDSPLRKPIMTIQRSGEKAAAVVQDLLTLARRGVAISEVVNLNDVIHQYLKSPEYERLRSFHTGIVVETRLEPGLLNIAGSPVHLSKTIMNLISNAAEAVPEGGSIIVSTGNRYIDRPVRGYEDVSEGDYVVLTVADTGIGISSEDIKKIFEPFYTKKKMGRSGTGLGMSVVWGAVKDHHGYIDVESREGEGTTFTLYFPASRMPEGSGQYQPSPEPARGRGETILIVDDVAQQRDIAAEMLKGLGYSVTTVGSGEEAVEYIKTKSVDLVLLDMIMDPGIDGLETYRQIIQFYPGQKAVIASGFSETERVREAQRLGAGRYVKKPFLSATIAAAVRAELDK